MATTKTDAADQTQPQTPTTDPAAGDRVTGKDADKAVNDFLTTKRPPEGYSIARDNRGEWVVRKG